MASWHPNDLVSDRDLSAYETDILTVFGPETWIEKRQKALDDWLVPIVESAGFVWERFRTRYEPTTVWSYVSSAYADVTAAAVSLTADDLNLGTIFASASNYLYIGSPQPFRGISVRVLDTPSSASSTTSVHYWADGWTSLELQDASSQGLRLGFTGGGSLVWAMPADWTMRTINGSGSLYWVRVSVSAAITAGTKGGQVGCIRRSRLCGPVTAKTLEWIMQEAITSGEGPWRDKAASYGRLAEDGIARVLPLIGGEFESVDTESDLIDEDEASQTAAQAGSMGFTLERY